MTACCPPPARNITTETPHTKPRYAVDGNKDNLSVQVELPGVKKENVEISLDGEVLNLHAKRSSASAPEWKTLHRELSELDFSLRLKLNAPVDETRMTARLEHGVLTLNLPVREAAKPRRIEVN